MGAAGLGALTQGVFGTVCAAPSIQALNLSLGIYKDAPLIEKVRTAYRGSFNTCKKLVGYRVTANVVRSKAETCLDEQFPNPTSKPEKFLKTMASSAFGFSLGTVVSHWDDLNSTLKGAKAPLPTSFWDIQKELLPHGRFNLLAGLGNGAVLQASRLLWGAG